MAEHQDSEVITKSKVEKAIELLKEQKPKEREDVSDRDAVRQMRRYIEKLTSSKYGYTYDEVSEMLQGLGINLTGSRIKYLIGELKKSSRRRQMASDNGSSTSENGATETQQAITTTKEAEESPVKSTRGKKKNQQPAAQEREEESERTIEPNRSTFVPKIYRDDEI